MWLCNSKAAIEHKKKCKDCNNCYECQWIDAASEAMEEHGTIVEIEPENHPLQDVIIDRFNGIEIN
tara:strand:- start:16000 stop:16197 length:198 start_codon:yes stop_codon:yes gene_type:complete